jgi:hypothetical protein
MWATELGPVWLITPLWVIAMGGYLAAGFGLLALEPMRRVWQPLVLAASAASVAMLIPFADFVATAGIAIDIVLLVLVRRLGEHPLPAWRAARRPLVRRAAALLAMTFVAYGSVVVALRPWALRIGTTGVDRRQPLPGDARVPDARYRVDHAIAIAAPPSAVWPWLVQMGQDRAGFYSYDRLERLVGDDIRNADRIVPEWQQREVGDLVRAVQPDYLGGVLGDRVGWRVVELVPGRAMVLEGWGAFVVEPLGRDSSRLVIRTRGAGKPSFVGAVLAPLDVLVFQPMHVIMQRAMLRGIRTRAEEAYRGERTARR